MNAACPNVFFQLLFPFCAPSDSGVLDDHQMPFYSNVSVFINMYAMGKDAGSGYGHEFSLLLILVAHVGCRCCQFWGQYVVLGNLLATCRQMLGRHLATLHFGPRQCCVILVGCRHVGFTYVGTRTKSKIVLMYSVLR